jgi:uncharacterized membrane protein
MEALSVLSRFVHVLAGIVWLGMLYFFNFVNGPFAATLDGDTKRKVVPELMPRALFFFRWGALWTWATGVILLGLVFHMGGILFEGDATWGAGAGVMTLVVFLAPFAYDALQRSALGKDARLFGTTCFALVALVVVLMAKWGGFGWRAFNIHLGVLFGTVMAWNVWFRIWPAQQQIIGAIKGGTPPDPAWMSLAGTRSRHNTYMSVPLLFTMINNHTGFFSGNAWLPGRYSFVALLAMVLVGWHVVWQLYRRAARLKGF